MQNKDLILSDKELVKKAALKDKEAFRALFEKYHSKAFGIAYEILRSKEDAEDVVQESFVKAYLSLPDFRFQSSFYTWLYRIVHNMAIDYKRKLSRRGGATYEFEDSMHSEASTQSEIVGAYASRMPDQEILNKERAKKIDEAMREISDEHRAVIMLREVDGLNYDQIAEATGVSKGTIMSRLHYARKKLQSALKDLVMEGNGMENGGSAKVKLAL